VDDENPETREETEMTQRKSNTLWKVRTDKWETHVAMIRLVRTMEDTLRDSDMLSPAEKIIIDNTLNTFLSVLPRKVADEVLHG
jgi:hypothetical protein